MKMKIRIKVGQCYITKNVLPGQKDLYVSFKSGLRKTKTRIIQGVTPNFNQVLQLELDNIYLTVKVKDAGLYTCFGGFCTPFNSLIADTQIDLTQAFQNMETIQGYYSLKSNDSPAGKIYLTLTPLK